MARVVIPSNAEKALALAKLVFGKHQADGASSPLNVLQQECPIYRSNFQYKPKEWTLLYGS